MAVSGERSLEDLQALAQKYGVTFDNGQTGSNHSNTNAPNPPGTSSASNATDANGTTSPSRAGGGSLQIVGGLDSYSLSSFTSGSAALGGATQNGDGQSFSFGSGGGAFASYPTAGHDAAVESLLPVVLGKKIFIVKLERIEIRFE